MALHVRADQFLGEERVPFASLEHRVDQRDVRSTGDGGDPRRHLAAQQTVQFQPHSDRHPAEIGDPAPHRGTLRRLIRSIRADQHDVLVHQVAGQQLEQVPSGAVRPVEVLEPDHDDTRRRQPLQQFEHRSEQTLGTRPSLRLPVCQLAEQSRREPCQPLRALEHLRCRAVEVAEQIHQRTQRHDVSTQLQASTDHQTSIGAIRRLREQRGLSHPRRPTDEHHRRATLRCRARSQRAGRRSRAPGRRTSCVPNLPASPAPNRPLSSRHGIRSTSDGRAANRSEGPVPMRRHVP